MTADTILSVREAVAYMDKHYHDGIPGHLTSESHTRRILSDGRWPCTRTAAGRLGITVADLRAIWETPWTPPAKAS